MNSLVVRRRVCLTNGYRIRRPKVTNQKPRTISNFFKHWEESFTNDYHYSPFLYLEASGAFIWPTRTATGIQTRPQNTINKKSEPAHTSNFSNKKPRTLTMNTLWNVRNVNSGRSKPENAYLKQSRSVIKLQNHLTLLNTIASDQNNNCSQHHNWHQRNLFQETER